MAAGAPSDAPLAMPAGSRPLRIGAAYNVFDGVELLEASISSVRPVVSFVCVVMQRVSNFGAKMPKATLLKLQELVRAGTIDELVDYAPRTFSAEEKRCLVAVTATPSDMSGARPEAIADPFCNEVSKREIGRRRCLARGCDLFLSMDADEFYPRGQLADAAVRLWRGGYDVVTCRMRCFMVDPRWELRPHDETDRVTAVARCHPRMGFRLCVPTTFQIDPTRRLDRAVRVLDLPRSALEMHHMTLVRADLESKFASVTNRQNYAAQPRAAAKALAEWRPDRAPVAHPHPARAELYRSVHVVPDYFGVPVGSGVRLPAGAVYSEGRRLDERAEARLPTHAFEVPDWWGDSAGGEA